jgi:hypothetical protein
MGGPRIFLSAKRAKPITGQRHHSGLEVADMARAARGTGKDKTRSQKRSKQVAVKDLSPRRGGEVKGGGINRIVVTNGSINAKL